MEILTEYKEQIIVLIGYISVPFLTFLLALGTVYLFGRMWGLVKTDRAKNTIAFVVMVVSHVFYFTLVNTYGSFMHRFVIGCVYTANSVILYVLFGFRLYDRLDDFQDKKFGRDKPRKPRKR